MTGTTTTRPAALAPGRLFRGLALAEAVTWTLLLGGILLRALQPDLAIAVTIGGALHGFVFLAYGAAALLVGVDRRWRAGVVVLAVLAAVVPFATVPLKRVLGRRGLLVGDWRRDPDGRDRTPLDGLVRALVRRPRTLLVVAVVAVVAVFAVLLVVGPPGR